MIPHPIINTLFLLPLIARQEMQTFDCKMIIFMNSLNKPRFSVLFVILFSKHHSVSENKNTPRNEEDFKEFKFVVR